MRAIVVLHMYITVLPNTPGISIIQRSTCIMHSGRLYTRKNAQVATDLQTSCNKSVHKLLTRCIRTACSEFVRTSLEQAVDKL